MHLDYRNAYLRILNPHVQNGNMYHTGMHPRRPSLCSKHTSCPLRITHQSTLTDLLLLTNSPRAAFRAAGGAPEL